VTSHCAGLAAGEVIQPFVSEDRGELVGIVPGDWHQDEPGGLDRVDCGRLAGWFCNGRVSSTAPSAVKYHPQVAMPTRSELDADPRSGRGLE
jgi:hypothetical protein